MTGDFIGDSASENTEEEDVAAAAGAGAGANDDDDGAFVRDAFSIFGHFAPCSALRTDSDKSDDANDDDDAEAGEVASERLELLSNEIFLTSL